MTNAAKLTELIDQLVNEKTFTLEGLKAITHLRETADGLEKSLKLSESRLATMEESRNTIASRVAVLEAEINVYKTREASLVKREVAISELEKRCAVAEAKEATRKETFDTVFRNTIIRESVSKSVQVAQGGGYTSSMPETEQRTIEKA